MPPNTTTDAHCSPPLRRLAMANSPQLAVFSSVSENTLRFSSRLDQPSVRIPLRPRIEGEIELARPFVLLVPTYGGGERNGAVPRQVVSFLNNPINRGLLRGVITAGNTNFGEHYCLAGAVIAAKCKVPELYRFELLGTDRDAARVNAGLATFWAQMPHQEKEKTL